MGSKCCAGLPSASLRLEKMIQDYDMVLFIPYGIRHFSDDIPPTSKKVLLIITEPYEALEKDFAVEMVSKAEAEELLNFYHMYEFTDNFLVLAENHVCSASIFYFVKTGILTAEEAWQALIL